jgi:hypothetical protein
MAVPNSLDLLHGICRPVWNWRHREIDIVTKLSLIQDYNPGFYFSFVS